MDEDKLQAIKEWMLNENFEQTNIYYYFILNMHSYIATIAMIKSHL